MKMRAASRLNAAGVMARQRRDSVNSLQSGISDRSGGWKTIAGEDSDSEDTPSEEKVRSPGGEDALSPTSPDKGPPPRQESSSEKTDTDPATQRDDDAQSHPPNPVQRPPRHHPSMPGTFDAADVIYEDDEDKAARKSADPLTTTSFSTESHLDDLWDMASRVKKLVIG